MSVATRVPPLGRRVLEPRRGYRFAPENIVLHALIPGRERPASVLDLGAGCGVLGLIAADRCAKLERLILIERDPELAALARANAEPIAGASVVEADLRELDLAPRHDLVVANPPFYDPGEGRASRNATTRNATHAHHGGVEAFVRAAAAALTPTGDLWLLYPADRLARALVALAASALCVREIHVVHARHSAGPFRCWICASHAPGPMVVNALSAWTPR